MQLTDGDGKPEALGPRRQRSVLAMLVLARGEVVQIERIIDELWEGTEPRRAAKSLYPCVSSLRRILDRVGVEGARISIVNAPGGYRLMADPGTVDFFIFEDSIDRARSLLHSANPAAAAQELSDALALWRGEPFGELSADSFLRTSSAHITSLRTALQEDLYECRLVLGDVGVVDELREFVDQNPLRERGWSLLMRCLQQLGRPSEVRRVFDRFERLLSDEVGMAPSAALRSLLTSMSTGESHADSTGPLVSGPLSGLVGRQDAWTVALEAIASASAGDTQTLLFEGDAGVGKTAMVGATLAAARDAGFRVAVGPCDDDGMLPFAPWVRVFAGLDAPPLVLPDLRPDGVLAEELDAAQWRFIDSIVERLRTACEVEPLMIVFEDLQWIDQSSLRCLTSVVRAIEHHRLLIVATHRASATSVALRALANLHSAGLRRCELLPLAREHVDELASATSGRRLTLAQLDQLYERTQGNPLFVRELLRSGAEDFTSVVPAGVTDVIRSRLETMPTALRDVVRCASVAGRVFTVELLRAVTGQAELALFDQLDAAVEAGFVEPSPGHPSGFRFVHALVRDAVLSTLAPLRRARLHDSMASALSSLAPSTGELFHHRWEARTVAPDAARVACRQAAEDAERNLAVLDAAKWWRRALVLEPSASSGRAEILLRLGRVAGAFPPLPDDAVTEADVTRAVAAQDFEGAPPRTESFSSLLTVIDIALNSDNFELGVAAAAALGSGNGSWHWCGFRIDNPDIVGRLELLLRRLPLSEHAARSTVMAKMGVARYNDASTTLCEDMSALAVAEARLAANPEALVDGLISRALSIERPGREQERLLVLDEAIMVARQAAQRASALLMRASTHLILGDRRSAAVDIDVVREIVRAERLLAQDIGVRVFDGTFAVLDGEIARAERIAMAAIEIGSAYLGGSVPIGFLGYYSMRLAEGRLGELVEASEHFAGPLKLPRADLVGPALLAAGRADEAMQLLADPAVWVDPPQDWLWLVQNVLRAELAVGTRHEELARRQYTALLPYADCVAAVPGTAMLGLVSVYLGDLAQVLGDESTAERHYRRGVSIGMKIGAEVWISRAKASLGLD